MKLHDTAQTNLIVFRRLDLRIDLDGGILATGISAETAAFAIMSAFSFPIISLCPGIHWIVILVVGKENNRNFNRN